jgi:predicted phage tail protein
MKSKFVMWLEAAADTMFSELWQAKALIVIFGILGVMAFIGAFWNPAHFATTGICAVMVLCGISEYKKEKRK